MMDDHPSIRFMRAARGQKLSLPEIAERADLTMHEAREILFRGCQARPRRLQVNDKDRQNIWIEVLE